MAGGRPGLRAVARALLAALAAVACGGDAPPAGRYAVVARLGDEDVACEPPQVPAKLKRATATRDAVGAAPGSSFEATLPPAATGGEALLLLSTAALANGDAPGAVRFVVRARSDDGWRDVFDARTPADGLWRDHQVDLGRLAPGAARFRFETRPEAGAPAGELSAWWGSVAFLRREPEAPAGPPNVIVISLDTLGAAYLGAFGADPEVSPHLDAFLREAHDFRRAYAQYGNTLVSHASLFTALYPAHHDLYPDRPLRPLDTLVAKLSEGGWLATAFTEGAFVSANFGFARGFDWYDDGAIGLSNQMAGGARETFADAADWLARTGIRTRFFLFVHTYEVHAPYMPRDGAARALARRLAPADSTPMPAEAQAFATLAHNSGRDPLEPAQLAMLRALYSGEIQYLDRIVGEFLERVRELSLEKRTVVVLTADHGDQFGEAGKVGHSESLHNRVLHVPLALRGPGIARGATDVPVQLVDVMPTLLELVGLPVPEGVDGRSLAPVLRGERDAPGERAAISEQRTSRGECRRLSREEGCRLDRLAVQTRRFKLVSSALPEYERLYDLDEDPLETRDVAAEHPGALAHHRALLRAYRADARPRPAPAAGARRPELDAETLGRLRALGYLE